MPTAWTDEAAARLANMLDLSSANDWVAETPVFALLYHHPADLADIQFLARPLDVPIPEAVSASAPDGECVAMAISAVLPAERPYRRGADGAGARVTVAVDDTHMAAVYRYHNGVVRRTDAPGAPLRAQMHALWQLRIRFEALPDAGQ